MVGLLVVVALAMGGYGGWLFLQNREAEARAADRQRQEGELVALVEAALAGGDLVQPEGESAYDWYTQLRTDFPESSRLADLEARALPQLRDRLDAFYDRWTRTSSAPDSEWPRVRRMGRWASELSPGNGRVRAQHLYADARHAFESGNITSAEERYRAAIEAWPEWALPYNSLGVLMVRRRNYRSAATWYEEAASRDPDWPFPRLNLGGVYANLGRYNDAARTLDLAEEVGGAAAEAWANLSSVCLDDEAYPCALGAARRALDARGDRVDRERMRQRVRYLSSYIDGGYVGVIGYQEFIELVQEAEAGAE